MKFVRCLDAQQEEFFGIVKDTTIYRLEGSIFGEYAETGKTYAWSEVTLLFPCVPTNLYCVGLNFADHVAELGLPTPEQPANFLKPVSGVVNPGDAIVIPRVSTRTDYEGEMAIVIKDKIKNISEAEALQHILGVTPLNDVTERVMSYTSTQVTYSKSFDTFTSFGPVIDTDIDPENTVIRTYLNGKQVQEGRTADFIFSCAYIVSYFSQGRTLFPGDVISTGTPSHVLPLQEGDIVEVELEGLSQRLVNPVVNESINKEK